MSKKKPKRCPFCGGKAVTFHIPDNTTEECAAHPSWEWKNPDKWVIGCRTQMCYGNYNHVAMVFFTKKQAIKTWNRRADK